MTSLEIARRLVISARTVETHLQRAYAKLGVASRSDLATVLGLPRKPARKPAGRSASPTEVPTT